MSAAVAGARPSSPIRALFAGAVDAALLPYPSVAEDENRRVSAFLGELRAYLDANLDRDWADEHEEVPAHVLAELKRLGLFGIAIPRAHGGMGLSHSAYARVFELVRGYDTGLGIILGVHVSIGTKGILLAGTPEQQRRFLPRAATGEWMASFALTEPLTGSDAAGVRTRAEPQPDGSYRLNGHKIWIGNGSFSDVVVVFAQTPVAEGETTRDRVTAFVVQPSMPGYERASGPLRKMGGRGSNQCELKFHDVRVPAENVLGEVGGGFKLAVRVLNGGRVGVSAGATGGLKQALRLGVAFAKQRRQFGRAIAEFELIREKLARIAADAFAAESATYLAAGLADRGDVDYALEAAAVKVWTTNALGRAADELVQLAGGRGFVRGYPFERMYRDVRITRIFEGTNEVLRLLVGGAARAAATASGGGVGGANVADGAHPRLQPHLAQLAAEAGELRDASRAAVDRWGDGLTSRQLVVARLGDMAIELFVRAATLSRTRAVLKAFGRGERATAAIPEPMPLDAAAVERVLSLCDLACELSAGRFADAARAVRGASADALLDEVARHALACDGPAYGPALPPPVLPPPEWAGSTGRLLDAARPGPTQEPAFA